MSDNGFESWWTTAGVGRELADHNLAKECYAAGFEKAMEFSRHALMNQAGDNLCWLKSDDPLRITVNGKPRIPPRSEFLESCSRYHAQISEDHGVLEGCRTIAQLEAEIARLKVPLSREEALKRVRAMWNRAAEGGYERTMDVFADELIEVANK